MDTGNIDQFMAITGSDNTDVANQYIEMAGGNLETALSLYFEHGGNPITSTGGGPDGGSAGNGGDNNNAIGAGESDADIAKRLQEEMYKEPQPGDPGYVRPPDQARHETLAETHVFPGTFAGYGGVYEPLRQTNVNDIFDRTRPVGVFNQRFESLDSDVDSDENERDSDISDEDEDDDRYEYVEQPVVELDDNGNVRESKKMVRRLKNVSKQEMLAMMFKPPFDMISKLSLERAKSKATERKKWVMINIQDVGIFQCQELNRDLWSSKEVKKLVRKNFIFLQYQYESPSAQQYIQYYGLSDKEILPHIAILDPMTGERLRQWNKTVPKKETFLREVEEFLNDFSLDPNTANPIVREPTPEIDPTTLTEEQQMDFAIRQSMGLPTAREETEPISEEPEIDPFESIEPVMHDEPPNRPGITTRIQIRTGDGRRIVRRFNAMDDTVRTIYEFVKSEIEGFDTCKFNLTNHQREDLLDKLDLSIEDAGLKNSSLLLSKEDDDDD
ncbi:hypothetical protein Kpol_1055p8 [Vanderwaltozyma polyspora DSM 70294]|uniref:UBX domain-containing protein n=1 Tax=Vanderwaltozyma polyspora (strain ATCC 22028 / DSM 70294 / BCRC 21397 / CBS 2163 / NBRC 10782 / NRRL Y-8283 / UCD 57-17) TaxID=436907 RepID=A7TG82_VANPO|nr:uncharacterized protein Kpol_1055p8 [Vanderwaltozyma polyspora DSM 70294]EDO18652.1 hypothetical protein Kpol_1055p8 [Vanderwaltozyma polyspora DSM 70294]